MKIKLKKIYALGVGIVIGMATMGASNAVAEKPSWAGEKCKGIVKKGKNDCGAKGHVCAGHSTKDSDPNEWIYVPKGLCAKITGGKTNSI